MVVLSFESSPQLLIPLVPVITSTKFQFNVAKPFENVAHTAVSNRSSLNFHVLAVQRFKGILHRDGDKSRMLLPNPNYRLIIVK